MCEVCFSREAGRHNVAEELEGFSTKMVEPGSNVGSCSPNVEVFLSKILDLKLSTYQHIVWQRMHELV